MRSVGMEVIWGYGSFEWEEKGDRRKISGITALIQEGIRAVLQAMTRVALWESLHGPAALNRGMWKEAGINSIITLLN